ncbi:MAG: hypothetical protein P0S94_00135 [Simkaniaceae bacterium]|nr:hypothetical protein [Simkaniaceae bacterium]
MTSVTSSATLFWVASRLTDPPCEVDRAYKQFLIAKKVGNYSAEAYHSLEMVWYAALTLLTALPGIILRAAAIQLQENPYQYLQGNGAEKTAEGSLSLLSWNVCGVGGGFTISDGGVTPFPERVGAVADAILKQDADVVCLYELMDNGTTLEMVEKLKETYAHIYFNIGPQAMGPNSGIFVASKVPLDNFSFTPFPKDHLDGRSKPAEKGFVSFNAGDVAQIFATHLGHSEICGQPTDKEVTSRKNQMSDLMEEVRKVKDLPAIVTGDLNLSYKELQNSDWHTEFNEVEFHPTWGGDQYCALLMEKEISDKIMYDYTLLYNNNHGSIQDLTYLETGYDATTYSPDALSDHKGVYTVITT